ncbi:MAG: hypothetical protein FWE69_02550 [Clostridiales bacterium]|nr:hypothetical protein [Clostridiales bacterium]
MKTITLGIGMLAGAAVAVSLVSSLYPDLPRRMMRDGRRVAKHTKRAVSRCL